MRTGYGTGTMASGRGMQVQPMHSPVGVKESQTTRRSHSLSSFRLPSITSHWLKPPGRLGQKIWCMQFMHRPGHRSGWKAERTDLEGCMENALHRSVTHNLLCNRTEKHVDV